MHGFGGFLIFSCLREKEREQEQGQICINGKEFSLGREAGLLALFISFSSLKYNYRIACRNSSRFVSSTNIE